MMYGIPKGSILRLTLFNMNLCDLFLAEYSSEFTILEDDITPYECGKSYDTVINKLEIAIEKFVL